MEVGEEMYHATPQTQGRLAHQPVDNKQTSTRSTDLVSLPVSSSRLGLMGKIDIYKGADHHLIERKYRLKKIYRGHLYQLWAEYFCMVEMGYAVDRVSFYEISTNKMMPQSLPGSAEWDELCSVIAQFRSYDPSQPITTNITKCTHCIYSPLCEKTETDNVYQ